MTAPTERTRIDWISTMPRTVSNASRIVWVAPAGALSTSVLIVSLPSRQPATAMTIETATLANASPCTKPKCTAIKPNKTAIEPSISDEKCRALELSAVLFVCAAMRFKCCQRIKSTQMAKIVTVMAIAVASSSPAAPLMSLFTASKLIKNASTINRPVSTRAATASILPCP